MKMNFIKATIIFIGLTGLVACNKNNESIVIKNGLAYISNEITPFTGTHTSYDENGKPSSETNWENGIKSGKHTEWYSNKKIKSETQYNKGDIVSYYKWDQDGELLSRMETENGKLTGKAFWTNPEFENINHYAEIEIKDGLVHSESYSAPDPSSVNDGEDITFTSTFKNGYLQEALRTKMLNGEQKEQKSLYSYNKDKGTVTLTEYEDNKVTRTAEHPDKKFYYTAHSVRKNFLYQKEFMINASTGKPQAIIIKDAIEAKKKGNTPYHASADLLLSGENGSFAMIRYIPDGSSYYQICNSAKGETSESLYSDDECAAIFGDIDDVISSDEINHLMELNKVFG